VLKTGLDEQPSSCETGERAPAAGAGQQKKVSMPTVRPCQPGQASHGGEHTLVQDFGGLFHVVW
jgi:hypothetical protein